jgi:tetratricopeptide (TPR) repeat protein
LDHAIQINPQLAEAYCNRGAVRLALDNLEGALADLDKAIALNPHDVNAYCHRGFALFKKRDLGGALADFNKAIKLDPRLAWGYQGRGTILMANPISLPPSPISITLWNSIQAWLVLMKIVA